MSELIFIIGICLVTVGVALWSIPAGLVVLGALLLIVAVAVKAGAMRAAGGDA